MKIIRLSLWISITATAAVWASPLNLTVPPDTSDSWLLQTQHMELSLWNMEHGSLSVTVSQTGAAHEANGQVTASTTAGTFVSARATRRSCLLINTDASITVYYGAATVTSGNGIPLKPGQSAVVTAVTAVQVIAASGSPVVAYWDEYD